MTVTPYDDLYCRHGQSLADVCFMCEDPNRQRLERDADARKANGDSADSSLRKDDRPQEKSAATRKVRLTSLSTIKPKPVRWVWDDRIPAGEVTLTPGRGGIGKSTFHAWLMARLTLGELAGIHHGTPRACIVAAAEDSFARTIVPRLIAAGAALELIYRADVINVDGAEVSLSLPTDCDGLGEEIKRTGAALVSLDPLMSTLYGGIDTHKDREVRTALEPLAQTADRTGCAILGNAHFNKSNGNDPLSLIMGSAGFGNVSRAALGFVRDSEAEDGSCVISQVKNNLGRMDLPSLRYVIEDTVIDTPEGDAHVGRLVMKGESDRSVAEILSVAGSSGGSEDGDDARSVLQTILGAGPVKVQDAYERMASAGFSKDQARRAKERLKVRSEKYGAPGDDEQGWRWTLPHPEDGTKGAKGARSESLPPSPPSVPPSYEEVTSNTDARELPW